MTTKAYNFCAGPAVMPDAVLEEAKAALVDWQGSGVSVLSISHRHELFVEMVRESEADLRKLLSVPENYKILFMQGGASLQFSMVPMNLLQGEGSSRAAYIDTGYWSKKAIAEAKRFCKVDVIGKNAHAAYDPDALIFSHNPAYLHFTPNETIDGIEFNYVPKMRGVPIVADMSSSILSQPIDVTEYDLIYAGAQKNIGPAGMAIVIVREGLIDRELPGVPTLMQYQTHAKAESLYHTPPAFTWFVSGLVFKWLLKQGGLKEIERINKRKAMMVYNAIDSAPIYQNNVDQRCRSRMNIPFHLENSELEKLFLDEAKAMGFMGLKGHRSLGGVRVSLYNAMSIEGTSLLVEFMKEFAKKHG